MGATLTYSDGGREPLLTFALDCPETIVGRAPAETVQLSEIRESVSRKEPFHLRIGDTLYIGIPGDLRLSRSHFTIRRLEKTSGEAVFLIHDLRSRCGFKVNDMENNGSEWLQLNNGDRIHRGFEFVFQSGDRSNLPT